MAGETTHPHVPAEGPGPTDPLVGKAVGGYTIRRKVGQGGMGAVYQAYDEKLDRFVALKFLPENLTRDPKAIERFSREARATAKLEHPNVVSILGVGEDEGRHYIAMQYVSGGTLDAILQEKGRLGEEEAMRLVRDAARGLDAAHRMGIIHRDVKPENIMIDSYGTVKVSDFGLATMKSAAESRLTMEGQIVGTPFTMSPEQCDGKEVDKRADIYSLGATFFRMITGKWPYEAESAVAILMKHLHDPVPDPRAVAGSLGTAPAAICMRMMAKKPEQRYAGMNEVTRDLERAISGALLSRNTTLRLPVSRSRLWGTGVALLLLVLGIWAAQPWADSSGPGPQTPAPGPATPAPPLPPRETSLARAVARAVEGADALRARLAQVPAPGPDQALARLTDLDRLGTSIEHLADLDPGHPRLSDLETEWKLVQSQISSKVAHEVVEPILEIQDPREMAAKVAMLGPRLMRLPRVAEVAFESLVTHIAFLVHDHNATSLGLAQDLLWKALQCEVSPEKMATLAGTWSKVRQAAESLPSDEAERLRMARVALTDPAMPQRVARHNLKAALFVLRLMGAEARELEVVDSSALPPGRADTLRTLEAAWSQQLELQEDFGRQLGASSWDAARATLSRWEASGSPEVVEARRRLEAGLLLEEVARLEKEASLPEALVACARAQTLRPRDAELRILRARLEDALAKAGGKNPLAARVALMDARAALLRGRADLALEILDRVEASPAEATEVAAMRGAVQEEQERARHLQTLLETRAWSQVLTEARPHALAEPPSLEARFAAASACLALAEEARAAGQWESCHTHAEAGLSFLPHEPALGQVRAGALSSWGAELLRHVTEVELEATRLVREGKFQEAQERLAALGALASPVALQASESLSRALGEARRRASDIASFQRHLLAARQALQAHEAALALEHVEEASGLGIDWSELASLRRHAQFERSRAMSLSLPEGPEKLRAMWEARTVLEGEDSAFDQAFLECRRREALRSAAALAIRRVSADAALASGDIALATSWHSEAMPLLEAALAELRREPTVSVPDALLIEKNWWGDFVTRVSEASRRLERSEESLRRYQEFMGEADVKEAADDLPGSLAALRSARAHASHLGPDELSVLEARLQELTRRVEALAPVEAPQPLPVTPDAPVPPQPEPPTPEPAHPKLEEVTRLAAKAAEAEEAGHWGEALECLASLEALGLEGAELDRLLGRVLLDWRLHLTHNQSDQAEFEALLTDIQGKDPAEGIRLLQRFIRLNEGNLMVRKGRAQAEVERLESSSHKERGEYVGESLERSRILAAGSRQAEAEVLLMESLVKYPADPDLMRELARVMGLDKVSFKGGEFEAGTQAGEGVEDSECPPWKMTLAPFALARTEVSNLQYALFMADTKAAAPEGWVKGAYLHGEEHLPVTGVSLEEARKFAQWAGARLPTEFEWEFAARSGGSLKRWPWGSIEDLSRANVDSKTGRTISVFEMPQGATAEGLLHMCGNAAEWTESPFLSYPDKGFFGSIKEPAPLEPGAYVVRGGSLFDKLRSGRNTSRKGLDPRARKSGVGLRLCWSLDEKEATSLNGGGSGVK